MVKWTPPGPMVVKLNTDGSLNHVTRNASAGGVIRDSDANWIRGFTVNIGIASSFTAELWGLREGLRLCRELGFQHINIEMDSASIAGMLQEENQPDQALSTLIVDCYLIMKSFNSYTISHIFREGNKIADRLAEMGHRAPRGFTLIPEPPPELYLDLSRDKRGHMTPRF